MAMTKLALVRDKHLNLHDIGNYYGLTKLGVDLLLCGTRKAPWDQIMEMYPLATPVCYSELYEVFHHDPDVIDVPDAFYDFSGYFVDRFEKTVVVTWENLPGKVSLNPVALETLRKAWKVTARSGLALYTDIRMHEIDFNKIFYIPGAVDTDFFQPAPTPPKNNVVLFVGRLTQEKGILDLIWAVSVTDDIHVNVIGEGDPIYESLANHYAPGKFNFLGHVDRKYLPQWYQQASVFCLPTLPLLNDHDPFGQWVEQFGQVYIEAMACGLPIITYSSPVVQTIIPRDTPMIAPRDWGGLAYMLATYSDPNNITYDWKANSEASRKRALEKFSQIEVAKRIKDWYEL